MHVIEAKLSYYAETFKLQSCAGLLAASLNWHLNRLESEGVDDDTGALVKHGQECQLLLLTARIKHVLIASLQERLYAHALRKSTCILSVCMSTQPLHTYPTSVRRSALPPMLLQEPIHLSVSRGWQARLRCW